jgi:hypothetical protein
MAAKEHKKLKELSQNSIYAKIMKANISLAQMKPDEASKQISLMVRQIKIAKNNVYCVVYKLYADLVTLTASGILRARINKSLNEQNKQKAENKKTILFNGWYDLMAKQLGVTAALLFSSNFFKASGAFKEFCGKQVYQNVLEAKVVNVPNTFKPSGDIMKKSNDDFILLNIYSGLSYMAQVQKNLDEIQNVHFKSLVVFNKKLAQLQSDVENLAKNKPIVVGDAVEEMEVKFYKKISNRLFLFLRSKLNKLGIAKLSNHILKQGRADIETMYAVSKKNYKNTSQGKQEKKGSKVKSFVQKRTFSASVTKTNTGPTLVELELRGEIAALREQIMKFEVVARTQQSQHSTELLEAEENLKNMSSKLIKAEKELLLTKDQVRRRAFIYKLFGTLKPIEDSDAMALEIDYKKLIKFTTLIISLLVGVRVLWAVVVHTTGIFVAYQNEQKLTAIAQNVIKEQIIGRELGALLSFICDGFATYEKTIKDPNEKKYVHASTELFRMLAESYLKEKHKDAVAFPEKVNVPVAQPKNSKPIGLESSGFNDD